MTPLYTDGLSTRTRPWRDAQIPLAILDPGDGMEQSPAGATSGNQWQMRHPRKRLKQADPQPVATHGNVSERMVRRVDGSSQRACKTPAHGIFRSGRLVLRRNVRWYGSRYGAFASRKLLPATSNGTRSTLQCLSACEVGPAFRDFCVALVASRAESPSWWPTRTLGGTTWLERDLSR